MKFSRDEIMAQGARIGSQSVYLTGFSYSTLLSAAEIATRRYMWSEMTDSEWDEISALTAAMSKELFTNIMIGSVVPFVGAVIPENLLLCDGGTYSREDYPNLYSILPAALVLDADTFTLPDMSGLAAVGATIARPLLTVFGEEEHTLTVGEMPAHSHDYVEPINNVDLEDVGVPEAGASRNLFVTQTGSTGGGQPHNNLQPSISLYWCVVAR